VETEQQLDALRALDCDRVQGFLLGRPLPAEGLIALLRARRQLVGAQPAVTQSVL
jgi:EAL domain-containing protein (putative c-di-GMP-specific phosphodiesterase class I)